MKKPDLEYTQKAIELAWQARKHGNHPFGALLVGPEKKILLEAENTVVTEGDITGHAELNLIRNASRIFTTEHFALCTIYASTEPCPMCAGAIFWSNIRRVVFGLGEDRLYELVGQDTTKAVLRIPCRDIFQRGKRSIEVIGPVLEEEAGRVHRGFWAEE